MIDAQTVHHGVGDFSDQLAPVADLGLRLGYEFAAKRVVEFDHVVNECVLGGVAGVGGGARQLDTASIA